MDQPARTHVLSAAVAAAAVQATAVQVTVVQVTVVQVTVVQEMVVQVMVVQVMVVQVMVAQATVAMGMETGTTDIGTIRKEANNVAKSSSRQAISDVNFSRMSRFDVRIRNA